jgi:hypothetical protein
MASGSRTVVHKDSEFKASVFATRLLSRSLGINREITERMRLARQNITLRLVGR